MIFFIIGQLAFDVAVLFILGVNIVMWDNQREINKLEREVVELLTMPHPNRRES